jgi:hypothetical protein
MAVLLLLTIEAAIEAGTGLALVMIPQVVSDLLLGTDLTSSGIAVARVAGIALISLGLACWMSRRDAVGALAAILTYNVLVTAYLMLLALGGELIGVLLWPAIVIHAALTLLSGYQWFNGRALR